MCQRRKSNGEFSSENFHGYQAKIGDKSKACHICGWVCPVKVMKRHPHYGRLVCPDCIDPPDKSLRRC